MYALLLTVMTLFFSWQPFFARKYTENYAGPNPADASNIYNIIYGVVIGLLTFVINGFRFTCSLPTVLLGVVNGIALIIYNKSLVKGSILGPYSFLMLCSLSGGILVPLVYNMLFMGERLSGMQIFGIFVLLGSILIMNAQGLSFKGERPSRVYFISCVAIFLANGFYSQLMNIQQYIMSGAQRAEMIIITYAVTALVVFTSFAGTRPKALKPGFQTGKKALLFALLACVVSTFSTNVMVYLLSITDSATILFAVNNGGVLLLSAIYSIVFFREKASSSQIIGMTLSIISIILLSI